MLHIHYNGFDFLPSECNLDNYRVESQRSARGFVVTNIVEAHCSGEFCLLPGQHEYDLAIRIQAFLNALNDGGDFSRPRAALLRHPAAQGHHAAARGRLLVQVGAAVSLAEHRPWVARLARWVCYRYASPAVE
jgi:hypothetical protein